MRILAFAYGLVVYVAFLATLVYAMAFVADVLVPKTVNSGPAGPVVPAVLINAALLAAFAIQHTIMARPRFKVWWTRFVPAPVERSTFVLCATLLFALLMWQWRPLPATIWNLDGTLVGGILTAISAAGWLLLLYSTFLIDHFDLFGLRQVWLYLRDREYTHHPFMERSAYRYVRHPIMLGFLVAFCATPHMTFGHFLLAGLSTAYILVGIRFEERDLKAFLGDEYRCYRTRTSALFPWRRRKQAGPAPEPAQA